MTRAALDSSVLIAALREAETHHEQCALLLRRGLSVWAHALPEIFATLSGAPGKQRMSASLATRSIELSVLPRVQAVALDDAEVLDAIRAAESVGARGGAIYDFLHLRAARKVRATIFYTLNVGDFRALVRAGDPQILHPAQPA